MRRFRLFLLSVFLISCAPNPSTHLYNDVSFLQSPAPDFRFLGKWVEDIREGYIPDAGLFESEKYYSLTFADNNKVKEYKNKEERGVIQPFFPQTHYYEWKIEEDENGEVKFWRREWNNEHSEWIDWDFFFIDEAHFDIWRIENLSRIEHNFEKE